MSVKRFVLAYEVVADYEGPLKQVVHHANSKEWNEEDFRDFMTTIMGDSYEQDEEEDGYDDGYHLN